MYQTILVPLDRSKRAEAIFPHVENLALNSGVKVVLMTVIAAPFTAAPTKRSIEKQQRDLEAQEKRAAAYLADMRQAFRQNGIETATLMAHGTVVDEIIAAAKKMDADLIAIASHGRGGLSRAFYGSVTAALLQRIDRPLLLIRSLTSQDPRGA
jgi:nucleotide-binding universal stress UspA family protein